jgi:PIN domain nuclease of toxin-antitoxin system
MKRAVPVLLLVLAACATPETQRPAVPSQATDHEARIQLALAVAGQGFTELPITLRHGHLAGELAGSHKDPFDRMRIAQARIERMVLVSHEMAFDVCDVHRLW